MRCSQILVLTVELKDYGTQMNTDLTDFLMRAVEASTTSDRLFALSWKPASYSRLKITCKDGKAAKEF